MDRTHVVVIDPGVQSPEIEEFNRLVQLSPLPMTYHLPGMFGTRSLNLEKPELIRGIFILGSMSSVHDQLPWQRDLSKWLMPMMLRAIPTLGLCFGHQLIAHLFGGKIGPAFSDLHKERGLREIELASCRLWGSPKKGALVVSHREAVLELPPDFMSIGTSRLITYEAMEHKNLPIWGLQAHPEAEVHFFADSQNPSHSQVSLEPKVQPNTEVKIPLTLNIEELAFGYEIIKSFLTSLSPA